MNGENRSMPSDHTHTLRQLIRSYGLQIDYINLLVKHGRLQSSAALEDLFVLHEKMDAAAERLYQLILAEDETPDPNGRPIHPALIPDLQYI
jgi:hypothetical protein